jgi:MoaE-MoaD fusion protein
VVNVLYFAVARERAGCPEESFEWSGEGPLSKLVEAIVERHPTLRAVLPHLRWSVNREFVELSEGVREGDEVAVIPPVSGGSGPPFFRVVDREIALDEVVQAVSAHRFGGLVTFTGTVRGETRGRRVLRLEYEAYVPMAEQTLARIGQDAGKRWPGTQVAILHRIGVLLPGDAAVVIAAAAAHRAEAFRACEHTIESLKRDVPIFKKEIFEDGGVWVGMGP